MTGRANNKQIDISVVIVTWSSEDYIGQCLDSLIDALMPYRSQIIVVDNHSPDNTADIVRTRYPKVELIENRDNLGFGGGNNVGISQASGTHILLLNPDTRVNRQAITVMTEYLKSGVRIGAVGPKQLNADNRIIFTYSTSTPLGFIEYVVERTHVLFTGRYRMIITRPQRVNFLNLGCVMLRREIIDSGILFDPKVFLYGEELDLFTRIARAGWQVYYLKNCYIHHFRDKSVQKSGNRLSHSVRGHTTVLRNIAGRALYDLMPQKPF